MNRYFENGQYFLNKLTITTNTTSPVELDIQAVMRDMTIYESIYSNTVSGNVTIVESSNMIREYAIGNYEKIRIEFTTAGVEDITVVNAIIYKVSKPFRMSEHASGHTLYFVSEESFNSIALKTFTGHEEEISGIVQTLYDRVKRQEQTKPINIEKTKNIENYLFTGNSIFEAINMVAEQAVSSTDDNGYVFYEDLDNFNFVTLEHLYQQEPVIEYVYKNSGIFDDSKRTRNEEAFNSYQDFEIMDYNSYSQKLVDGEYGGAWGNFSIYNKTLSIYNYSIASNFVPGKSLGAPQISLPNGWANNYNSKLALEYTSNFGTKFIPAVNGRMVKLRSSNFVVSIGVFGDSTLRVGKTCIANIPNWSSDGMQPSGADRDIFSGKFLITEIKHVFTQKLYTQRVKIIKDAYEVPT